MTEGCESCKLLRELVEAKDALIKALSEKPTPIQLPAPLPLAPSTWQIPTPPSYYIGDPYPGWWQTTPNVPFNNCGATTL